jgi:hypothetical protein
VKRGVSTAGLKAASDWAHLGTAPERDCVEDQPQRSVTEGASNWFKTSAPRGLLRLVRCIQPRSNHFRLGAVSGYAPAQRGNHPLAQTR